MLYILDENNPEEAFPDPENAEKDPDGLLAVGGDLSPLRLLNAYRNGIFPWYNPGESILWWSPDPRMLLFPNHLKISHSMRKLIRKNHFRVSMDQCFEKVIIACSKTRKDGKGTWLSPDMIEAYIELHQQGHAHSVETWVDDQLVGGLYGINIGKAFFGESMFSLESNASKIAFVHLAHTLEQAGYPFIDCQVYNEHLESLGAELISRNQFLQLLKTATSNENNSVQWFQPIRELS